MINRKILNSINSWLWKEKILILKWARQVWKTTILKEIQKNLEKEWKKCAFLFADDISNENIFKSPENLIYFLELKYNFKNENYLYLFVDEFQYIKNAWLFLKNIFDKYKEKLQIIVSWSSSLEITKNTEFLTWRNIEFYIDRIDFKEFFEFKNSLKLNFDFTEFEELEKFYSIMKDNLDNYFFEFLSFWWYPEVVKSNTEKEKIEILASIYKNYIEKDIIHFLKIDNIGAFNNLIKILSSQVGILLNQSELANTLWISRNTVIKYLDILEWTFIFSYIKPFYTNIRKELSKMPKVFCEDMGILSYILWKNFTLKNEIDLWVFVENFAYKKLSTTSKYNNLYFYQTISKSEIDFVLENFEKNLNIFEVKYRNKVKIPIIFSNFSDNYKEKCLQRIIVTKDILKKDWDVLFIPASLFWLCNI